MKTYSELIEFDNFDDRLEYLYIGDKIGNTTFGASRYLNQKFYKCKEWLRSRDYVIARDNGCDLGVDGCDLTSVNVLVHHINPITEEDIINRNPKLFDPENLISTSFDTHRKIHYGINERVEYVERSPNDTCPWKK